MCPCMVPACPGEDLFEGRTYETCRPHHPALPQESNRVSQYLDQGVVTCLAEIDNAAR